MYQLRYNKIPQKWNNGLPIGNGRLAAMYWGDENKDIFSLNHEYLWRGKYRGKVADEVADKLPVLRELLKKRDYFRATVYANLFWGGLGGNSGTVPGRIDSYQPAGNLVFEFGKTAEDGRVPETAAENRCILDVQEGLMTAERAVKAGGENKVRCEAFCDCNDGGIIVRWKSCGEDKSRFAGRLRFERTDDPEAEYSYSCSREQISFTCRFICGIEYRVEVRVRTDGRINAEADGIDITDASEVICCTNIILSEGDIREFGFDFPHLLEKHTERFRSYMDRICFELDAPDCEEYTDVRIRRLKDGAADIKLQALYFHYGRYLMLSSCICGKLPPNLQGKWNQKIVPAWKCDYHLDINLQMNEWMLESMNFPEFAEKLTEFLLTFMKKGRVSAKNLWGCRGIFLPLASDVWADCTPESFGYAVWVGAAAWIAQPMWKHYLYTGDKEYLRDKAYRFFKEVAWFYEDFLAEDEEGVMQIMPSQSPENRFVGAGKVASVGICTSSAIDVQLAYDALGYAIAAAEILETDACAAEKWKQLRSRLPEFAVGSNGLLREWNEEFEEEEPGHRHLSHLYGLFPSDIFTPGGRRKEYDAAVKAFDHRMESKSGYTGWSRAWIANICARIGRPEDFYEQVTGLLTDFATESLLDIHPDMKRPGIDFAIFQIDGNFGMVSAVSEALCSSFDGKVHLLHALPKQWADGHLSGFKLPGGHTLSLTWKNGRVKNWEVTIGYSGKVVLVVNGKDVTVEGRPGETVKAEENDCTVQKIVK